MEQALAAADRLRRHTPEQGCVTEATKAGRGNDRRRPASASCLPPALSSGITDHHHRHDVGTWQRPGGTSSSYVTRHKKREEDLTLPFLVLLFCSAQQVTAYSSNFLCLLLLLPPPLTSAKKGSPSFSHVSCPSYAHRVRSCSSPDDDSIASRPTTLAALAEGERETAKRNKRL